MSQEAAAPAGVKTRTLTLHTYDGQQTTAFVAEPDRPGRHPAIVFGQEAMGMNTFNRKVAVDMAAQGYVTIVPDYYRGVGPSKPDDYTDFSEVMVAIGALDFRQATYDVMAGTDWLRAQSHVDPERIAVWGYCTGGTLAMMAAALDRRLGAAVLFFPSQPKFEQIDAKHPAHPVDMVWNIACPVLVIYGDQDHIMPPELLAELRGNFAQWKIENEIHIYPGAGHAFSAPAPHMHNAEAATRSWTVASAFVGKHLAKG